MSAERSADVHPAGHPSPGASRLRQGASDFLVGAIVTFALLAVVQPFALDGRLLPKHVMLATSWGLVFVAGRALGGVVIVGFYLALYGLILYVDKSNFGLLSGREAGAWALLAVVCYCVNVLIASLPGRLGSVLGVSASVAFQAALLTGPFAIATYTLSTGALVSEESIRAVLQTNPREALGFARQFMAPVYGVLLIGLLACVVPLAIRFTKPVPSGHRRYVFVAGVVCLVAAAVELRIQARGFNSQSNLAAMTASTVLTYRSELEQFKRIVNRRAWNARAAQAHRDGPPRTFVIVLGESQNKDHMGAYGYHRDTTPWLSRAAQVGQIQMFHNVYASHTVTANVLSKALTESTQYNGKHFYDSTSVVEIANASGFNTVWISNHPVMGAWDNFAGAIGSSADSFVKLNPAWGFRVSTVVRDEAAVDEFRRVAATIDPSRNTLIVIHLMGSHAPYCDQFPPDRTVFTVLAPESFGHVADDPRLVSSINCYDNSIRYTDFVVQQLFEQSRAIPNMGFVMYIADHAEAVSAKRGHNPDLFDFEMARVPMFVRFDPGFADERRRHVNTFLARRDRYVTSDMMYDTLLGLMGIVTPHYAPESDFSSAQFAYSSSDLLVLDGQRRLTEDPRFLQRAFVAASGQRIIADRAVTLGVMQDAKNVGAAGFHVAVRQRIGDEGESVLEVVKSADRAPARLDEYLSYAARLGYEHLTMELRDVDDRHVRDVFEALEALNRRYPGFKERAIVESSLRTPIVSMFAAHGWHASYILSNELVAATASRGSGALRQLALAMSAQLKAQNIPGISFDVIVYPFVSNCLSDLLDQEVVFHGRAPELSPWEARALDDLRSRNWSADPRLATLQVPVLSDFRP